MYDNKLLRIIITVALIVFIAIVAARAPHWGPFRLLHCIRHASMSAEIFSRKVRHEPRSAESIARRNQRPQGPSVGVARFARSGSRHLDMQARRRLTCDRARP